MDPVVVVATTSVLGDIARNSVCDGVTVETLMSPGQDPHSFELSARQAAFLRQADLVIANGLNLEEGIADVILDARSSGTRVLFVADLVDPIPFRGPDLHGHGDEDEHGDEHDGDEHDGDEEHNGHEDEHDGDEEHNGHEDEHDGDEEHNGHEDEHDGDEEHNGHEDEHDGHEDEDEHAHEHGSLDPHVWMDPLRMASAARLIAAELGAVVGSDQTMCAVDYAASLEALDAEVASLFAEVPVQSRKLVTNHDAFGYFAERYGFEVVGTIIPSGSTLAEPSASGVAALVETIEHEGVPAIFAETTQPADLAEVIASEIGAQISVVTLYTGSLGERGSGAETYEGMIRTNAQRIVEALRG